MTTIRKCLSCGAGFNPDMPHICSEKKKIPNIDVEKKHQISLVPFGIFENTGIEGTNAVPSKINWIMDTDQDFLDCLRMNDDPDYYRYRNDTNNPEFKKKKEEYYERAKRKILEGEIDYE